MLARIGTTKNLDELNAWLLEKWFAYATSPSGTAGSDDLNGRFSIASVARILERHRPSQRPVGDGIFHNSIFGDVDGIPLGANFVERPRDEVQSCDVLLAVIGPNWLDARDEEGIAGSTIRMTLSASKLVRRYSATFQ